MTEIKENIKLNGSIKVKEKPRKIRLQKNLTKLFSIRENNKNIVKDN